MTKQAKIRRIVEVTERHTEAMLIMSGVLTLFLALFLPIRIDIQLLVGGFGVHMIIAGIIAKSIPLKS
jgi:hypothetical protein